MRHSMALPVELPKATSLGHMCALPSSARNRPALSGGRLRRLPLVDFGFILEKAPVKILCAQNIIASMALAIIWG